MQQTGTRAVALFGGVFDPVHNAHLEVARRAHAGLPIARVRFLPSGNPPHKPAAGMASADQRLRMLELALADEPGVTIDDRELRRAGPSYTVDTLREVAEEEGAAGTPVTIFFLIGSDNIPFLRKWNRAGELFALCTPVVIPRPGYPPEFRPDDLPEGARHRVDELNERVLAGDPLDISSSAVRERIESGAPIADLVPPAVVAYIEKHRLYRRES